LKNLKHSLSARLPSRQETLAVFSVVVFIVFSWTLYRAFWWLPSWLEYLNIWSVLILLAYILAFALFESLAVMGLLLLLCWMIPGRYFKDQFVAQGSALAVVLGIGGYLIQRDVSRIYKLELWQTLAYPLLTLIGIIAFVFVTSFVFKRIGLLTRLALAVAERMTIFAYLYVPLGLIGALVVIARNLW
jgi:hypothetical protein